MCLLQVNASLFDDVDMTLGTAKATTEATRAPGESLFGGAKMSQSTKDLQGGVEGASSIPASGVYSIPKPRKKVASATVSTSLTGPGSGSLFDEVPNAGASLPETPASASRFFTSPAAQRQSPVASSSSSGTLFEVEGLVLPLSLPDAIPKSRSRAPGSVSVPRPQGPPLPAPKKLYSQVSPDVR